MSDKTQNAPKEVSIHAVIDRFEDNDLAVLLVGEDESEQVDWPVKLLPEGVQDGDHLRVTITIDKQSRQAREKRVEELRDRLLKRSSDTASKKNFKL